jgi:hypothetical protein
MTKTEQARRDRGRAFDDALSSALVIYRPMLEMIVNDEETIKQIASVTKQHSVKAYRRRGGNALHCVEARRHFMLLLSNRRGNDPRYHQIRDWVHSSIDV